VDRHNPTGVTNPNGDLSKLQVLWGTSSCIKAASAEFKRTGDVYVVEIKETPVAQGCQGVPDAHAVEVTLSAPVPAERVSIARDDQQPSPTPIDANVH
jgi:hypothetical protein